MIETNREEILQTQVLSASVVEKTKFIFQYINQKDSVLDVGCVGQAIDKESNLWLHGLLHKKIDNLLGVDIDVSGIERLKESNFNVLHVDDLGDKTFDVIVMGDIIEHIGDIESLLLFYKKKLNPEGRILITTPNPFSFRQLLNILFFKRPFINAEHTCFLDPFTILELFDRSQLEQVDFAWIFEHEKRNTFTSKVFFKISKIMFSIRRYYAPNFGVVCKLKSS